MSSKDLLAEYAILASKLENINETLQEMNSVDVAQLINTIRLVERKMGFVYTSFKSSVYSVVNQEQDQELQNQSQERIYIENDEQDHQGGNQGRTPEHHHAHRSFQLDNGEEEVSFMDPPQRPQTQTPYQASNQTQQTRNSQTPYQNLMMRSSLFRNSNRSRMSLSQFSNMQQQQQQEQDHEQLRSEQPTSYLQRLQQGNVRPEAGGERSIFAQSRGVGSKWSRSVDTNRPRYQ